MNIVRILQNYVLFLTILKVTSLTICENSIICKFSNMNILKLIGNNFHNTTFNNLMFKNVRMIELQINKLLFTKFKLIIPQLLYFSNIKIIRTNLFTFVKNCDQIEYFDLFYNHNSNISLINIQIITLNMFDYISVYDIMFQMCLEDQNGSPIIYCSKKNIEFLNIEITERISFNKIRSIYLNDNNISVLACNNTNFFRFAYNLVHISLENNAFTVIECKSFIQAKNLRFIEFSNNEIIKKQEYCILNYNRNIQEILYSDSHEYVFNQCDFIERVTKMKIIKQKRFTSTNQVIERFCKNKIICHLHFESNNSFLEVNEYSNQLKSLIITNNRNVLFIKKVQINEIYYQKILIMFNCKTNEYDFFQREFYKKFNIQQISHIVNTFINNTSFDDKFEQCLKNNRKYTWYMDCSNKMIKKMTLRNSQLLINITVLFLNKNKIVYLKTSELFSAPNLVRLDISKNPIFSIELKVFNNFPNLRFLIMFDIEIKDIFYLFTQNNSIQNIQYGSDYTNPLYRTCHTDNFQYLKDDDIYEVFNINSNSRHKIDFNCLNCWDTKNNINKKSNFYTYLIFTLMFISLFIILCLCFKCY